MADLNVLKNTYFALAPGLDPASEPVPETADNCLVTPLIDMRAYADAVKQALDEIATGPDSFIYLHHWSLGLVGGMLDVHGTFGSGGPEVRENLTVIPPFYLGGRFLVPTPGEKTLLEVLIEKARLDVDVRVLGWVSFALLSETRLQPTFQGYTALNAFTVESILALRKEPKIGPKAAINDIAHTAGSAHCKLLIIGNTNRVVAFTGGLDFVVSRWADTTHVPGIWHDVTARVEGPGVQPLYDFFAAQWEENRLRPPRKIRFEGTVDSHDARMPAMPGLPFVHPMPAVGTHSVQSLRTAPQFHYTAVNRLPTNPPLAFAPNGIFEFRLAVQKALEAAVQYIYIEDQSFLSIDILGYVSRALTRPGSALKVILVTGQRDPDDPPAPGAYRAEALDDGLMGGGGMPPPGIVERVRFFTRRNCLVHSKTILIDDKWALIGSANCMRRSLFTDLEHSISVVDPDENFVREYRMQLWADHFGQAPANLGPLERDLAVWEPAWLPIPAAPHPFGLPAVFEATALPTGLPDPTEKQRRDYNLIVDPDSRDPWGFAPP